MSRQWLAGWLAVLWSASISSAVAGGVLVVAPHPDDDLLIASGVIANAVAQGDQVKVVYMTNGDAGGVELGLIRQAEAVEAQVQYLGTTEDDLIFLGYPDAGLHQIYTNYPSSSDIYTNSLGHSHTYASRGLGRTDYHSYQFGSPAAYNRANIETDLASIIWTYQPEHIVTMSEHDQHADHAVTYQLVKSALNAVVTAHPTYAPIVHKTIVWAQSPDFSPVWPQPRNPTTYHVAPPNLPAALNWATRESIDVPAIMQVTNPAVNPKYRALQSHISQGGAESFLGRFIHKDEIFFAESAVAGGSQPLHVDAGPSQVVEEGASVQLNGSASFDPQGGSMAHWWTQIGGPVVAFNPFEANPTFTAPTGLQQDEILSFQLVVAAGNEVSLRDLVTVTVRADLLNGNLAPQAVVTASSQNSGDNQLAVKAVDGVADGWPGDYTREWATQGQQAGAWIELNWSQAVVVDRVVLHDRPNLNDQVTGGTLTFSDGSSVPVQALANDGSATQITFPARSTTRVRFTVTAANPNSNNIGLAELLVFPSANGPANQAPIANAGADASVAEGATVQLNGSGSADPEGAALSYTWQQVSGSTVTLTNATSAQPSFTAPSGLAQDAELIFQLTVSDGSLSSAPDLVTITVPANLPGTNIAGQATVTASSQNAGDGQLATKAVDGFIDGWPGDYHLEWATQGQTVGAWIQLNWTPAVTIDRVVLFDRPNSNDHITGGTLTFSDGTSVAVPALANAGTATTVTFAPKTVTSVRFTVNSAAPSSQNIGLAELQVYSADTGNINLAPVANAGQDQAVAQGVSVQLNGSQSSDPEGASLSYQWQQVGGPAVTLNNANAVQSSFTSPTGLTQNTLLSFQLVVNDGDLNSVPDIVNVAVVASQNNINIAPQASVTASSDNPSDGQTMAKAVDGVADGWPGDYTREWATRGGGGGSWLELHWTNPMVVDRVVLHDRPNTNDNIVSASLVFSDGSVVPVGTLNNDGSAVTVNFAPRAVTSVRLLINAVSATSVNIGLAEMQVFGAPAQ